MSQIREPLVAKAVEFLLSPEVRGSTRERREEFLKKKQLTAEEIAEAFSRAGPEAEIPSTKTLPAVQSQQQQQLQQQLSTPPKPTSWTSLLAMTVVGSGLFYGASQLYSSLTSHQQADTRRLQELEDRLNDLQETISTTAQALESQYNELQAALEAVKLNEGDVQRNTVAIQGIQTDLTTLKEDHNKQFASLRSLALNKRQFPAIPQSPSGLPSWQTQSISRNTTDELVTPSSELQSAPLLQQHVEEADQ